MARPENPAKPKGRGGRSEGKPPSARESTSNHATSVKRETGGKWAPGQSANPGGRPKIEGKIRELAQQHGEKALLTLVALLDHKEYRARLGAAEALLNRGFGRPAQSVDVTFTQADLAAAISGLTDDEKRAVALGDLRPLASRR